MNREEFERCSVWEVDGKMERRKSGESKGFICAIGAVQKIFEVVGEVGASLEVEEEVGMCLVNGEFGRSRTFTRFENERTSSDMPS